jgi:hypothetical protein
VLVNRVLRRIFGPKRDEVAGGWRRLHNVKLHNLHASPNIVRVVKSRMRWAGETRSAHKILVEKIKGKRSLGIPKRRWKNNIKMDRRET